MRICVRRMRFFLVSICLPMALAASSMASAGELFVVSIDGSINPASSDYLLGAIERAEQENAAAVLIELDTPGGLVSATQDIIKAMLNSSVATIVYVTPRGATATSAGTFITLAANVAAMMPGTSIGAAHPVSLFGGESSPASPAKQDGEGESTGQGAVEQKIENFLAAYVESIAKQRNRNVEWAGEAVRNSVAVTAEEALELNVIDLVASSRDELLAAIDGRVVMLGDVEHELARFVADVQAVFIRTVWFLDRRFDWNIALRAVGDHFRATGKKFAEFFNSPGSDYRDARIQRFGGQLKPALIVSLASGTMGIRVRADLMSNPQALLANEWAGDRRTQEIDGLVFCLPSHHRKGEIATEFFTGVDDLSAGSADVSRFL